MVVAPIGLWIDDLVARSLRPVVLHREVVLPDGLKCRTPILVVDAAQDGGVAGARLVVPWNQALGM